MKTGQLQIVNNIIIKHLQEKPLEIKRMVTGIVNDVYMVNIPSKTVIVRMNSDESHLKGTEKHIALFSSVGIKVPEIIASDYTKKDFPVGYQVLSYLEGKDLGQVIESMTDEELKDLAKEVAGILRKLSKIATNGKFGWVGADESRLVDSWTQIMKADKIEERNKQTGVVGDDLVKKEKELYEKYKPYFDSVKSVLYFDDMSSKNILINEGKFVGLIDLDDIMYGDPIEAVGAIKASWYGTHHGEVYTVAIEDELAFNEEQRKMVTVYATMNRILWLSEKGIKFNDNTSSEIDMEAVKRDKEIINSLITELEKF
ncbi:MAG TPA: aminoglycoside phosphotransferase family protein [Candidatus Paceibacterota bacterium]